MVDISPFESGLWENIGDSVVNRLKITARNANSISVYFDKLKLSKNAELFIYNVEGTVITGPIREYENIGDNVLWGSNVFIGTSIIIEFKCPASEKNENQIHINKILYGINPKLKFSNKDSITGPGFGLSTSCNINAVCIAGWDAERRAIAQMVDEGGGWCSASLIMNTCGTRRPFILTANHCVFQNGSLINTNNSTFEFLWFSPTCSPTTNTTATLLFNGATLRSRWEQSDFALLELNQTISTTVNLNFLGWSRSTTPPNASVGIHHPMGDIMKISIENNLASIGQVRTFPNTAWRVVWDQGTVEGGSSGSPLFDNVNHRVVGQLFSNTQPTSPPCNQLTGGTNYGRFDISWTGGGTNDTRLSNWLDPTGSDALTTNTTNTSNLADPISSLSISGDDIICSTSNLYSVGSLSSGSSVQWQASPAGIVTINTPNSLQTTLTKNSDGVVTLTATISACGQQAVVSKSISIGTPPLTGTINPASSTQQLMMFNNITGPATTYVSYTWPTVSNITITPLGSNPYTPVYSYQGVFYFNLTGGLAIRIASTSTCGGAVYTDRYFTRSGGYRIAASPNPANDNITVSILDEMPNTIKSINLPEPITMTLYNINNTLPMKKWTFKTTQKNYNLNIQGIKTGQYILVVQKGMDMQSQQITIQ